MKAEAVAHCTRRATTEVAPGSLRLEVVFRAPAGQKLDERNGPSARLLVSATPPELLLRGGGADTALSRALELDPSRSEGVLHVSAMAASCYDIASAGTVAKADLYPACHVHQPDRGVPVRLTEGGTDRLPLVPAGMDEGADGVR